MNQEVFKLAIHMYVKRHLDHANWILKKGGKKNMEVVNYLTESGNSPFEKWLVALKDRKVEELFKGRLLICY